MKHSILKIYVLGVTNSSSNSMDNKEIAVD